MIDQEINSSSFLKHRTLSYICFGLAFSDDDVSLFWSISLLVDYNFGNVFSRMFSSLASHVLKGEAGLLGLKVLE